MVNEEKQPDYKAGEMHKRREKMTDGKRCIVYYTFGQSAPDEPVEEPNNV